MNIRIKRTEKDKGCLIKRPMDLFLVLFVGLLQVRLLKLKSNLLSFIFLCSCAVKVPLSDPLDANDSFLYIPPNGLIEWCERIGSDKRAIEPECLFYYCSVDLSKEMAARNLYCSDYENGNIRMGFIRK